MFKKGNIWKKKRKIIKKIAYCKLIFLMILMLMGCAKKENRTEIKNVEERDYATILMISEGKEKKYCFVVGTAQEKKRGEKNPSEERSEWECDDFNDLGKQYKRVKGKTLSLSHLKIVLLAMSNYDIRNYELQNLFLLMEENQEIAKTCPVLFLFEKEKFLGYLEKEKKSVGSYFVSLIKETESENQKIPWVKDYLKAIYEKKNMDFYYLKPVSQGWIIEKIREFCI